MMNTLKDKILNLRSKGYSYNKIVDELGCAKSTVAYHLSDDIKRAKKEWKERNKTTVSVTKKINYFHMTYKPKPNYKFHPRSKERKTPIKGRINGKIQTFIGNSYGRYGKRTVVRTRSTFGIEDVKRDFDNSPYCFYTGRPLVWENTGDWHMDHFIPRAKGGSSVYSNMRISCKEANIAKSDLYFEDLLKLCEDVLTHNGAKVEWQQ